MRWILIAALVAYSVFDLHAAELAIDESKSLVDISETASGVTVSSVPMPLPMVEVLELERPVAKLRPAKKWRLAKKKMPPVMLLTRTERRQVELLLLANRSPGDPRSFSYHPGKDNQSGLDELVLHRSFSPPQVVTEPEADTDDPDSHGLSVEVKLRLLLARFKAVEALALKRVPITEEALPENVRRRLFEARMLSVQAHVNKFGSHG